ncbi:MAG: 3-deoxy-7-phosphoheptulonate synthase [Planctomycetota bacterium]|jgi:3-deoxy-7-phosphoheptulonate synthase|nr:3-deoxy-7-phosphoheptulonate synthase [Planctomycetota bacterium]
MLIVMNRQASEAQIEAACEVVRNLGLTPHTMPGASRTAIGITGNTGPIDSAVIEEIEGVQDVIRVTKPYKLVSREMQPDRTVVEVGKNIEIGGNKVVVIAGPCSLESPEQAMAIAHRVQAAGAVLFRGGAYKPRTSPYSFQGLGQEGLEILKTVREETGLAVCTEAVDEESLERIAEVSDIIQIGARNMYNYSFLKKVGRVNRPVLLKRGLSATLEEYLMAAEYVLSEGNRQVILCERGIRTFSDHSRNTFDIGVLPAIHSRSHLPVLADPSHAAGHREGVLPLALAAVAAGADGLIVEVHNRPEEALSDGAQSLYPDQFEGLVGQVSRVAAAIGRTV